MECVLASVRCFDFVFFFFKQKTAYEIVSRDWSSDVCSSDLDSRGRGYQSAIGFKRFGNEKNFFFLLYGMFFWCKSGPYILIHCRRTKAGSAKRFSDMNVA